MTQVLQSLPALGCGIALAHQGSISVHAHLAGQIDQLLRSYTNPQGIGTQRLGRLGTVPSESSASLLLANYRVRRA